MLTFQRLMRSLGVLAAGGLLVTSLTAQSPRSSQVTPVELLDRYERGDYDNVVAELEVALTLSEAAKYSVRARRGYFSQ